MRKPEAAKHEDERRRAAAADALRALKPERIPRSKKERPASKGRVHKGRTRD
ncbi:hypothetical protein [Methylocystis bryophila]|uniref:hypothetical protein n=1 Tax=Methylocystis bryophila TaxID=655015 RepID=UPI001319CBC3|nr:hypothetical protein [Methylocystis bryophila]BDV36811.1 hypothetical protein DSM21852_00640 [Methylocystis bryophila]